MRKKQFSLSVLPSPVLDGRWRGTGEGHCRFDASNLWDLFPGGVPSWGGCNSPPQSNPYQIGGQVEDSQLYNCCKFAFLSYGEALLPYHESTTHRFIHENGKFMVTHNPCFLSTVNPMNLHLKVASGKLATLMWFQMMVLKGKSLN